MSKKPVVVAICIPVYDKITYQFFRSYTQLWVPNPASITFDRQGATHLFSTHSFDVVRARTLLTESALAADPEATHLLFVDDDMLFPPHALKRLIDHDLPVVGGLCHNRRVPYAPLLIRKHVDRDGTGFVYDYPENKLAEVDATGAGFLLVKREVFEAITEKHGPGSWWQQLRGISEDFSFMERARACGFAIHVDTGLSIGHVAEVVVDAAFGAKNRPFQSERWASEPREVKKGEPWATIVIPTYNQVPKHLKAAILSASFQTVPVEVIVVDDGSETPVPAEGWPENVRVLQHVRDNGVVSARENAYAKAPPENRGVAEALNTGIQAMRTKWFCWLSSDDLLDPRKVEYQMSALRAASSSRGIARLSFHRYQVFTEGSETFATYSLMPQWHNLEEQRAVLAKSCAINGSTVMIHKSIFDEVGLFNPDHRYSQDWEFWCRAGEKNLWYGISEILGSRRETAHNLTSQIADSPEKAARRRAEDDSIRERWAVQL